VCCPSWPASGCPLGSACGGHAGPYVVVVLPFASILWLLAAAALVGRGAEPRGSGVLLLPWMVSVSCSASGTPLIGTFARAAAPAQRQRSAAGGAVSRSRRQAIHRPQSGPGTPKWGCSLNPGQGVGALPQGGLATGVCQRQRQAAQPPSAGVSRVVAQPRFLGSALYYTDSRRLGGGGCILCPARVVCCALPAAHAGPGRFLLGCALLRVFLSWLFPPSPFALLPCKLLVGSSPSPVLLGFVQAALGLSWFPFLAVFHSGPSGCFQLLYFPFLCCTWRDS
jgi:hypothetical protein